MKAILLIRDFHQKQYQKLILVENIFLMEEILYVRLEKVNRDGLTNKLKLTKHGNSKYLESFTNSEKVLDSWWCLSLT